MIFKPCACVCPQLRVCTSEQGLTCTATYGHVLFDAPWGFHHVVGRLADKQACPRGTLLWKAVLGRGEMWWGDSTASPAAEWRCCRCEPGSDRRYCHAPCLFSHLSWRKREALDLAPSKTVSFCFWR